MMDVVLVNPASSGLVYCNSSMPTENIGIALLAATLREAGIQATIIDQVTLGGSNSRIVREILRLKPKLVGFSPVGLSIGSAIEIGKEVKSLLPEAIIVWGGHHASLAAMDILHGEPWLDAIVVGYGESTIVDLARAIGAGDSFIGIPAIYWRQDYKIVLNPSGSLVDIAKLPLPARDVMIEWMKRSSYNRACTISTSRGCPQNCSFCTTPSFERLHQPPYCQTMPAERVMAEIKYVSCLGVNFVWVVDDNFFATPAAIRRAKDIANMLIESQIGIKFGIFARADDLLNNKPCVKLLKRAGMVRVGVGFESFDDSVLQDNYNKTTSIGQNQEVYEFLEHEDLNLYTTFINFNPWIEFEGVRKNVEGLCKIGNASFYTLASCLQLFPGTQILERMEQEKLLMNYSYKSSPYAYKFLNPAVGRVAMALQDMKKDPTCQVIFEHDDLLLNTSISIAIENRNDAAFRELRLIANQINTVFLLNLIDLGERGWKDSKFKALKMRYITESATNLKELKEIYASYE